VPEAEEKTETEGHAGKQIQEETETDLKRKKIKPTDVCVFFFFCR
jgi:hypothetical protein